ncbi:MAG: type II toxin-antitoxin system PemK/MazF family toxin [Tagaea sp.]|nr:type II toxin-antitoxin system PemK/MazF family toxin [Tagaea sp.]
MKRGEIWTIAGEKDYSGKPRPAVIVRDDAFERLESVTVCNFTTNAIDLPDIRVQVEPSPLNGLHEVSRLMVEKVTSVRKTKLGKRIGRLGDADMARLDQRLLVYLGLAAPPRARGSA